MHLGSEHGTAWATRRCMYPAQACAGTRRTNAGRLPSTVAENTCTWGATTRKVRKLDWCEHRGMQHGELLQCTMHGEAPPKSVLLAACANLLAACACMGEWHASLLEPTVQKMYSGPLQPPQPPSPVGHHVAEGDHVKRVNCQGSAGSEVQGFITDIKTSRSLD